MKKEMSCLSEMCLDEFVRYISDKKIFCFGCGIQGKRMAGILYNWGIQNNLVAYIDNDEKKIGLANNSVSPSNKGILDNSANIIFIFLLTLQYTKMMNLSDAKNGPRYAVSTDPV